MSSLSARGLFAYANQSKTITGTAASVDSQLSAGVAHLFGQVPDYVELWVEDPAGEWQSQPDASTFVKTTTTQLQATATTLNSVFPGLNIKIVASVGASAALMSQLTGVIPDATPSDRGLVNIGSQTFGGAKTFDTALSISAASDQVVLSSGINQLTLNSGTSAAARNYGIPDVGASANFVMDAGDQTIAGAKTFNSVLTVTATGANVFGSNAGAATTSIAVNAAAGQTRDIAIYAAGSTQMALRENASNESFLLTNSKNLYLSTDASTTKHVTINTAGNVGIGTSSPDSLAHLFAGSAGTVTANAGTTLTVESSGNNFIQFLSPTTAVQGLLFGEDADATRGGIYYRQSANATATDQMEFFTGNFSQAMVINSSGNVGIGTPTPGLNRFAVRTVSSTGQIAFGRITTNQGHGVIGATGTGAFELYTGGTGTDAVLVAGALMTVSHAGAVTLGPGTTPPASHTANATVFSIASGTAGPSGYVQLGRNATATKNYHIGVADGFLNSDLVFLNGNYGAGSVLGRVSSAGSWTLGLSGFAGDHNVYGNLDVTKHVNGGTDVTIRNTDAGTSASASVNVVSNGGTGFFLKASTTMTGFGGADTLNIINETGGYYLTAGGSTWLTISDMRYKTKVADLGNVLDGVLGLSVFTYQANESLEAGKAPIELGLSAQEVIEVAPEIVTGSLETRLGLSYERLSVVLVKAIQELNAKLEAAEARIQTLEGGA